MLWWLNATRVVIRGRYKGRTLPPADPRRVAVKGRWDPLAARLADFVRTLPVEEGTIRIKRGRGGEVRLTFSRGFDPSLAQRIRNYALSLSR